jgi:hypothetical protein
MPLKPSPSDRPIIAHIGLMGTVELTTPAQLSGAYLNGLVCEPPGPSIDSTGPARSDARRPSPSRPNVT